MARFIPIPYTPTVGPVGSSSCSSKSIGLPSMNALFSASSREIPPQLSAIEKWFSSSEIFAQCPAYGRLCFLLNDLDRTIPSIQLSKRSKIASRRSISRVNISTKNRFVGSALILVGRFAGSFFGILNCPHDLARYSTGHQRRDGIPNLPESMPLCAVKLERVGEGMQSRRLPNSYTAGLRRMNRPGSGKAPLVFPRPGSQRRGRTIGMEAVKTADRFWRSTSGCSESTYYIQVMGTYLTTCKSEIPISP